MILGIRDVQAFIRPIGEAFGTIDPRIQSGPAVAAVALLACARDPVQRLGLYIDPVDRVALAKRQVQVAGSGRYRRARAIEWRFTDRRRSTDRLSLARPARGCDGARTDVKPPDAVIADVVNQDI